MKPARLRAKLRKQQLISVNLGPNDLLVLHVPDRISAEMIESMKKNLRWVLDNERAMVLDQGITYSIIRRPHRLRTPNEIRAAENLPPIERE